MSAIFALTLGLQGPGLALAHAHLDAATQASVACPHHAAVRQIADHAKSTHSGSHPNMAGCPDCCLAAHAGGAAVLPLQRDAAVARPLRALAARMVYFAVVERAAELASVAAANGARAPPAA